MIKPTLVALLLILILNVNSQIRPQQPVQILNWRTSTGTFVDNFFKAFCTECSPKICIQNLNKISKIAQTSNFKPQNIQNNKYGINQANVTVGSVEVSCKFTKRSLQDKRMDYILYMPISKSRALEGVVIYYHSTLFGIKQVPSSANTDQINAIAGLYISSAYAILFINYLGYESFDEFPHPYVQYPTCNVQSSIVALNHALVKLKTEFPSINKFKLFAAGYSEGAAYALWLEKCLSEPELCENVNLDNAYQYRAAAAMNGPYDLSQVVSPFLTQMVSVQNFPQEYNLYECQTQSMINYAKPSFVAITLISFIYYSQGMTDYQQKMNQQFWNMQCSLKPDQNNCKINSHQYDDIITAMKSTQRSIDIAKSIAHSAFGKKYNKRNQYLSVYPSVYETFWTNSVYGLVQKQLMNSGLFKDTIYNASAIRNAPNHNVFLFSLEHDSIISPNNTMNYIYRHKDTGKVSNYTFSNRLYKICPRNSREIFRVDHNTGQVLSNIFALSFIKNNTK